MRGSPHAHCLLWVKDAPKIYQDPDDFVIDKYLTATLPTHDHAYEKDRKIMELKLLQEEQYMSIWLSKTTKY